MTFHPDSLPDLSGKVYLVTGGNAGMSVHSPPCQTPPTNPLQRIPHGPTPRLPWRPRLHGHSLAKGTSAIASIKALHPNAIIHPLIMDNLSLASVVIAAKTFVAAESHLRGLISNAGIMATPFALTPNGHEAQWQTNYLAHWVLTRLLPPHPPRNRQDLQAGRRAYCECFRHGAFLGRASQGHRLRGHQPAQRQCVSRYGQSKLANVLHAKTLHRLYGPGSPSAKAGNGEIWTAAVQPGFVNTELGDRATGTWVFKFQGVIKVVVGAMGKCLELDAGSWTQVYAGSASGLGREMSGKDFVDIAKEKPPSKWAFDQQLGEKLEGWTEEKMRGEGWMV